MNESLELNPLEIYQATNMLQSGRPTKAVDALFFHGRSFGDDTGLFELASDQYFSGRVNYLALFGNEGERVNNDTPFQANPGKTEYKRRLIELGVPEDNILISGDARNKRHTRGESDFFIKMAKERLGNCSSFNTATPTFEGNVRYIESFRGG